MNPERNNQIKQLCLEARELAPQERAAFLAHACAGDDELRREVESLLSFDATGTGFLEHPAWKHVAQEIVTEETDRLLGQTIGHYQIQSVLGAGGMGKVFLAQDTKLGRAVAIKFLPYHFTADPEQVRRFEQEARAASALNHPNIITIYEVGQHQGRPFIVMEHVAGQTLRARLQAGKLTPDEAIDIAAQIADALAAAHHAGIIHRDIKPENIMLRDDGRVKVVDFGIARLNEPEAIPLLSANGNRSFHSTAAQAQALTTLRQTLTGVVVGTASYMSPEQARGEAVDTRTDVFSLGVVLYEMVTGQRLLEGATPSDVMRPLLTQDELPQLTTKLSTIPKELAAILQHALKKDCAERYESAATMLADLQRVQRRQATRTLRRVMWWGAGALVGLILLTAFAVQSSVREEWDERIIRDGHAGVVRQFALSPDGKKLVSVGNDAKVIVWDLLRGERLATLADHTEKVSAVTFSPHNNLFATASYDGTVIVWDADTYKKVQVLPGQKRGSTVISFTPDGRILIAPIDSDHEYYRLALWESEGWQTLGTFGLANSFVLLPDSHWLITQSWEAFNLKTKEKFTLKGETGEGNNSWALAALSPDAKRMVSVDSGGFLALWEMSSFWEKKKPTLLARLPAHQERGRAVAYSPDGRYIASGGEVLILWDTQTLGKLARFEYPERVSCLAFSLDSKSLIASYGDGNIVIWDLAEKEARSCLAGHCAPVRAVKFAPDGKHIVSSSDDRAVILWDTVSGQKQAVFSDHQKRVSDVTFSTDGQWIISSDMNAKTVIRAITAGQLLRAFNVAGRTDYKFGYCVAISPDKKWIVTGFGVQDATTSAVVADFEVNKDAQTSEIYDAAFSPDGRFLVCVTPTGWVFLWDVSTWQIVEKVRKQSFHLISVDFSPDGNWIVTGEDDGSVRLWQVKPLREADVLGRHTSYVRTVAFSPDSQQVASGSDDKTIALWNVESRKLIGNIGLHSSPVLSVAFAQDGKKLVAGEQDKTIRLYTRHRELWGRRYPWLDAAF